MTVLSYSGAASDLFPPGCGQAASNLVYRNDEKDEPGSHHRRSPYFLFGLVVFDAENRVFFDFGYWPDTV
jgi:hypothetical protein